MTGSDLAREIERITDRFPGLQNRLKQRAGTLSGGEQQMVAISRGLMANPKLLLLDEPSLGLAPLLVREIFRIIQELQQDGRTILLVEQNALGALGISNRAYVLEAGQLTIRGDAAVLKEDARVRRAFLGEDVSA
jgi:branched-chain amino acid transport system ATP-binding protein